MHSYLQVLNWGRDALRDEEWLLLLVRSSDRGLHKTPA